MDIIIGAQLPPDSPDFAVNFIADLHGSGATVAEAVAGLLNGIEIYAGGTYLLFVDVGEEATEHTVAYIDDGDGIVSYTDDLFIELVGFSEQVPVQLV